MGLACALALSDFYHFLLRQDKTRLALQGQTHTERERPTMTNNNEELCPQNFRDANEVLNNTTDLLLLIIAIFLPPITVLLKRGVDIHLLINILLWIFLFWIGGVLHAWYIV